MNSLFILTNFLATVFTLANGEPAASYKEIPVPIEKIYTPSGFDDNDNAQLIFSGEFANTCQSIGKTRVKIEPETKTIFFQPSAIEFQGNCLKAKVPFIKVVDLGTLEEGEYHIVNMQNKNAPAAVLRIHEAHSPRIDNFIYAPVETVFLQSDADGNRRFLILHGSFTNTCMHFPETAVPVKRTSATVIEVLPIIEFLQGENCVDTVVPFFKTVDLGESTPEGKYLIHIRAMNGSSINKIDYIKHSPAAK